MEPSLIRLAEDLEHAVVDGETDFVVDNMVTCVCKLGSKVSVYGTLAGLVNSNEAKLGKAMLNAVHLRLEKAVTADDLVAQKLLLRFCAELCSAGVLYMSGMIGLLGDFLAVTGNREARRLRREMCALLVMATLPWCCERLRDDKRDELEGIFTALREYMEQRESVAELVDGTLVALQIMHIDEGPLDELEDAWAMVQSLESARWVRPACLGLPLHDGRVASLLRRGEVQHQIPTLKVEDSRRVPGMQHLAVTFRLLPSLREVDPPQLWATRDHIRDTLRFFAGTRAHFEPELREAPGAGGLKGIVEEGAKQILNLPSVPKFEGVVIETIVGEMFRLPRAEHPTVFYGALLIELCKLQSTLHPALGAAISYLYKALPELQPECTDRFLDWFSFHLSNFDFKWLWADWTGAAMQPRHATQHRFVTALLEKTLRLTYPERLAKALEVADAPALKKLLPRETAAVFPFADKDHALHVRAEGLRELVSLARRAEATEVEEYVARELSDLPGDSPSADKVRVMVSAMVFEGRESFSHVLGILGRYLAPLRAALAAGDEAERAAAGAVAEVWAGSPHSLMMVMDKMVAMKLIAPLTLVNWLLESYRGVVAKGHFAFELLLKAIQKPVALVATVRRDLRAAKEELQALKAEQTDEEESAEVAEKEERLKRIKAVLRGALADQDEILTLALVRTFALAVDATARANSAGGEDGEADDSMDEVQSQGEGIGAAAGGDAMEDADGEAEEGKTELTEEVGSKRARKDDVDNAGPSQSVHEVWGQQLSGRAMQLARGFADELGECKESIECELEKLDVKDDKYRPPRPCCLPPSPLPPHST